MLFIKPWYRVRHHGAMIAAYALFDGRSVGVRETVKLSLLGRLWRVKNYRKLLKRKKSPSFDAILAGNFLG
jgi:hypothetical protein